MNTRQHPTALASQFAARATGRARVGAVLQDCEDRVFSWGWCHPSSGHNGRSVHAEEHAIARANRTRLDGATLYVCRLTKSGYGLAKPCDACQRLISKAGIACVLFTVSDPSWSSYLVSPR